MAIGNPMKIKRYKWCGVLLLAAMVLIWCDSNTQKQKIYKIGILSGFNAFNAIADGFQNSMSELGYVPGQNIVYDLHKVGAGQEKLRQAIDKFINAEIDLLLTFPTETTIKAKALIRETDIPIVFAMAGIEGNNLIESIDHPGGNITGIRFQGPDIAVKRFELFHELAPQVKRIWIAYDPDYPTIKATLVVLRPAVAASDVTLVEVAVSSVEEIRDDLRRRAGSGALDIDAILIMPDYISQTPESMDAIYRFAQEYNVPIVGGGGQKEDNRTVLNYDSDYFKIGKQAAYLADKVLKGTPAGTIMVATPQPRLRLNYKLARELGLTVPEGLLSRADEVIR